MRTPIAPNRVDASTDCRGRSMQDEVLQEAIDAFKANFVEAKRKGALMERQIGQFFGPAVPGGGGAGHDAPPTGDTIGEDHALCPIEARVPRLLLSHACLEAGYNKLNVQQNRLSIVMSKKCDEVHQEFL